MNSGKCAICNKSYPVASLARACEAKHEKADNGKK